MFAVIGTWSVDGPLDSEQLAHIADTVRQQPGFVRGYWGEEPDDLTSAHAVAFFEDGPERRRWPTESGLRFPRLSFASSAC